MRGRDAESIPSAVTLERRNGRTILVVPFRTRATRVSLNAGSGREDLFSPVDGFSPAVAYSTTLFDHSRFNHTVLDAYVSYKFGREQAGFSVGGERPFFGGPRLFLGAEAHDLTVSDDLWRISTVEQSLASVAFKNTFRDYYRRRGAQIFGVFRAGANNEFTVMARWDRHLPLDNTTSFSLFRDGAAYRANPSIPDQRVNAIVVGYTFDTRPMTGAGSDSTYLRHLTDDLYGWSPSRQPGLRIAWTSEIAGHALKGDAEFDRHIVNLRGNLPISSHTQLSLRGLFGFSNGDLPPEREFALGGIGSVHGYAFKEVAGTKMTLVNAEYRVNLLSSLYHADDTLSVFAFYDVGRVAAPFGSRPGQPWLRGTGFGVGAGPIRLEFGFRAGDIPRSRQILVRFSPTF